MKLVNEKNNMSNNLYQGLSNNPRKVFRKAHLHSIAKFLDNIDNCNLLGTIPSEILDMPIELIEKVDSELGISLIENEVRRRLLVDIYYKYPLVFSSKLNESQCRYLDMFFRWEREFTEEDKEILWELDRFDIRYADKCADYYEKREMLKSYIKLPVLSFDDDYTDYLFVDAAHYWHEIFEL